MRVATFNILHGRSVEDGVDLGVDPANLWRCVRELDADILALQEVDIDQERSGMTDLTALAAESMGAVSHRFVAAISGTPGARWMAATGEELPGTAGYGIALLSRYPASSWQVIRLPRIPTKFPIYLPGPNKVLVVHEEPRAAVVGVFHTPLGQITVANTHLSFVPGWNHRQLRRVVRDLRGLPGPHLLTGDLNMTPASVARWSRLRSLATAPTFPADCPERQLDHVLTDDPRMRGTGFATPSMVISDHRPLVVDVTKS
ncbi:MAG: endonuclease/exonuclease/phosphatase family protein [Mycobacterium sp.]